MGELWADEDNQSQFKRLRKTAPKANFAIKGNLF